MSGRDEFTCSEQFQFHKGTIRTNFTLMERYELIKFQFHKGTIRTVAKMSWDAAKSKISIP